MAVKLFAGLTYEQVVHKCAQTVMGVCVMRLKNLDDAEDCFQNTFEKLYTKSPDFNDENHLKAWLIKVSINECNNFIRKNRRTVSIDSLGKDPSEFSCNSDDKLDISWALMMLPPDYREILYLHYLQGYKVNEIGEILNKNPNTIKVMLKRGREKLKKIYGGNKF